MGFTHVDWSFLAGVSGLSLGACLRPTILHVERKILDFMHIWPMIVMVCQYAEFKVKWKTADEHLGCVSLPSHILFLFIFQLLVLQNKDPLGTAQIDKNFIFIFM